MDRKTDRKIYRPRHLPVSFPALRVVGEHIFSSDFDSLQSNQRVPPPDKYKYAHIQYTYIYVYTLLYIVHNYVQSAGIYIHIYLNKYIHIYIYVHQCVIVPCSSFASWF